MTTPHRAAVLGSPIAHSLSPALHNAGYAALGLTDWQYGRHEVDESTLADFVTGLDPAEWAGLSLTMPLKRAIRPLLDTVSDTARAVDAVNTVVFDRDGRRHGDNTDVPGLVNALRERGVERVGSAAVLGAGATASSALAALAQVCDGEVTAYVRSAERAAEMRALGERLGVPVRTADWADGARALDGPLTVSTTPAGATDGFAAQLTAAPGVLFDVLYHPWPTKLAAACQERGGTVLGGLDLLVHQAVLQFERFTGVRPAPLAAMRAAGEAALAG
ncbi:shikimate dehydrogenase [Kitasatospora phosalacinea]|uniref:Shikimate 5-dehydrogenase n=1 Tax=Kitasatospora phosalacinea TaxID=2065 RepID=A0A9W6PLV3_9ACTN|nr:shikimate dehydrogenase [Kitasatospora phosalacinea]GLW57142.1 shikimate 5-dehydrogenase [Kitasatospora phosalacinea]